MTGVVASGWGAASARQSLADQREVERLTAEIERLNGFLAKAVEILPVLCADAPDQPALEGAQQDGRVLLARLGVEE